MSHNQEMLVLPRVHRWWLLNCKHYFLQVQYSWRIQ